MAIGARYHYVAAMPLFRRTLIAALALSSVALAAPPPAAAAKKQPAPAPVKEATPAAQSLGKFDGWSAYASQDKVGRVCYLAGEAQQKGPAGKAPMAMATPRPAQ